MALISNTATYRTATTKYDFVEKIHHAQTDDSQVYTLEKLCPASLNHNAKTPGYINLILSPFVVARNIYTLATKKIEASFLKNDLKTETALHVLNFINMSLKTLLLLSYVGVAATEATVLLPYLISLAAISSLIGICHSSYHLCMQNKFLRRYDFDLFNSLLSLQRKLKKKEIKNIQKPLKNLLNKLYTQELVDLSILKSLETFSSKQEYSKECAATVSALITKVQNIYLLDTFKKIKTRYFSFTEEEKKEQLKMALEDFNKLPFDEALNKNIKKIEAGFLRKKLNLTSKIHSKLTLQTIEKIDEVIKDLSNEHVSKEASNRAKHHLKVIEFNSLKKQNILITNIALYTISLSLALINQFIPLNIITTLALAAISSAVSWINHIDIYGNLESTAPKIDYYNCLPSWIKWIHQHVWRETVAKPILKEKFS
jgi:hypothetical protein